MAVIVDPTLPPISGGLLLTAVWLNSAANPADLVALRYPGDSVGLTSTTRAEVRQLASRRRIVRRGRQVYVAGSLKFSWCTPEQVRWINDHIGEVVCVRDHVGTKVFGAYTEAPRDVWTYPVRGVYYSDLSVDFEQLDYSEAI